MPTNAGCVPTVPALAESGSRTYLYLAYRPFDRIMIEAKWSETSYPGVASIGTGDAMINGNQVHTIEAQIVLKL